MLTPAADRRLACNVGNALINPNCRFTPAILWLYSRRGSPLFSSTLNIYALRSFNSVDGAVVREKRLGSKSCGSETAASGIRRRNTDRHSDVGAMAATGGGKIRSRRYHIASKPYAKSKQVNRVAVFALAVQIEHVTLGALPPTILPCYCFVGDIFMACR